MDDDKPVTNKDLTQFSDAILNGVELMVTKVSEELKEEINDVRKEVRSGLQDVRKEINDFKADTPTRKEFDDLSERVDTFHPSN